MQILATPQEISQIRYDIKLTLEFPASPDWNAINEG